MSFGSVMSEFFLLTKNKDFPNTEGVTLSEKSVANGSSDYAALLVTCSVIAIYTVERSESSKFISGGFYSVNKDL